jgi:hypothetical protein
MKLPTVGHLDDRKPRVRKLGDPEFALSVSSWSSIQSKATTLRCKESRSLKAPSPCAFPNKRTRAG